MIPRLVVYRAAPPRHWRIIHNQYQADASDPYSAVSIGMAIQLGSRVISLQWRRP